MDNISFIKLLPDEATTALHCAFLPTSQLYINMVLTWQIDMEVIVNIEFKVENIFFGGAIHVLLLRWLANQKINKNKLHCWCVFLFQVYVGANIWVPSKSYSDLLARTRDSLFVREAAVIIFSTSGLAGKSVTGISSNRTKNSPKPALEDFKFKALGSKNYFNSFLLCTRVFLQPGTSLLTFTYIYLIEEMAVVQSSFRLNKICCEPLYSGAIDFQRKPAIVQIFILWQALLCLKESCHKAK